MPHCNNTLGSQVRAQKDFGRKILPHHPCTEMGDVDHNDDLFKGKGVLVAVVKGGKVAFYPSPTPILVPSHLQEMRLQWGNEEGDLKDESGACQLSCVWACTPHATHAVEDFFERTVTERFLHPKCEAFVNKVSHSS